MELKGELAKLKAEHFETLKNFTNNHRPEQSDQVTASHGRVVLLKETCFLEKLEVRRIKKILKREELKALTKRERLVYQHIDSLCSIRRRAESAKK